MVWIVVIPWFGLWNHGVDCDTMIWSVEPYGVVREM